MKNALWFATLLAAVLPVSAGAVPILDQQNTGAVNLTQGIGQPWRFARLCTCSISRERRLFRLK